MCRPVSVLRFGHLTAQKWTQVGHGLVLSAGGLAHWQAKFGRRLVDFAAQNAGGGLAVVDRCQQRSLCGLADIPGRLSAAMLHAGASCVLGPAIAASVLVCRPRGVGERLGPQCRSHPSEMAGGGRDGRLSATFSRPRVFFVTALLLAPA